MNSSKTEFITLGSRKQLVISDCEIIKVCSGPIVRQSCIKYLGTDIDASLSFTIFITNKCKKAMANLKRIQALRKSLTKSTCHQLVVTLVITHLDYANAILYGITETNLKQLQRIQDLAARVVCNKFHREISAKACREELHWLPIKARIEFKILITVYKALQGLAPAYIIEKLERKKANANFNLRSNNQTDVLVVPKIRKQTFAMRSFSHSGPSLWNALPNNIRGSYDEEHFRKQLKTHLFKRYYS